MRTPTSGSVDIHDIRTLTATGPIDLPATPDQTRSSDQDRSGAGPAGS